MNYLRPFFVRISLNAETRLLSWYLGCEREFQRDAHGVKVPDYNYSPLDWTKHYITLAIHGLDLLIIMDNIGCKSFHEGVDETKECRWFL